MLLLSVKYFNKQCFKIIHQLKVSSVSISVVFTALSFFTKMYYLEDLLAFSSWLIKQVQHMKELFMSRCTSLFSFLFSCIPSLWQYGLWSFQTGDTKLERFLPKNQHTQRKLLNFEFWINGELCQKVPKFDIQSQFSMSKIIRIFLNSFFIEEYQFRSTFFVIAIFR